MTEEQSDDQPADGGRDAWRTAVTAVVVTRAALLLVAAGAAWLLAGDPEAAAPDLAGMWRRWDADLYLKIAERGYAATSADHTQAFFPLFPLLVRLLGLLGAPPVVAGMAISLAASVVAGFFLVRLADHIAGPGAGRRALWYMLLFPTAVFLMAPYAEALFLAGAVAAFFYARTGRWWQVGPWAAVAMGSRHMGAAVLAGLAVEYLTGARTRHAGRLVPALVAGVVGVLPLVGFAIFLQASQGDAFAFLTAQREGWERGVPSVLGALRTTWETWGGDYPPNLRLAWRVEVAAVLGAVAGVGWALRRREWAWAAYMAIPTVALLAASWIQSVPRVLVVFFPLAILTAKAVGDRPLVHEALLASLALLAGAGAVVYTQGAWFF